MLELINTPYNQDIFFILMVASFFLIALIKGVYWKHAKLFFLGVFTQRYANQYLREGNAFTERVDLLTFLLMNINFTLIIAKLQSATHLQEIVFLFITIGLFFLVKVLLIKIFGALFKLKDLAKIAVFFSLLFDKTFSFILSPLIVLIYFSSFDIYYFILIIALCLLILLLILKIFWHWKIGKNSFGFSQAYIFLYLCTFEVFPVLLLGKAFFY